MGIVSVMVLVLIGLGYRHAASYVNGIGDDVRYDVQLNRFAMILDRTLSHPMTA